MDEYINRERARFEAKRYFKNMDEIQEDLDMLFCMLPAENVAPVRHGRWIEQEKYTFGVFYDCSICGDRILDNGHSWNYCPNCGADMRGSNDEGVTVREWISVDDRLPGKEEYTATTEYGTEYYIRLLIAYKTDTVEYEIGYYDGYKWMTEIPIRLIKDVVAWMPFPNMPQPPKEADEDDHA